VSGRLSLRSWSVRARLTLFTAGVLAALVIAGGFLARQAVDRALHAQLVASMDGSAALVRQFFRAEIAEYQTVRATLAHIGTELQFTDRQIDFVQPDGRTFGVPGRAPVVRVALAPPTSEQTWALDEALAPQWRVRVVASEAELHGVLRRLAVLHAVATPLAVLLVIALAWALVGRTLAPVASMASAAEQVSAASSDRRLPIESAGDELGRLGTTINALLDRLDGALTQQRQFLADAAHELRTPLARLRATLDAARSAPAGEAATLLGTVRSDVAAMSTLVDELMTLAQVDARGMPTPQAVGFLDDVVHGLLPRWEAAARAAGLTLAIPQLEEAPIRLDVASVERLVGILLDNAIRYTPAPGHVDVSVTTDGTHAVLSVTDDGIGVPPADRERITGRFVRGTRARQLAPDGAGLGLAIAQAAAVAHGATLEIAPGHAAVDRVGTAVTVRFPLTAAPSEATAPR
jgi:two-component system, OmpR family, sensor kinase